MNMVWMNELSALEAKRNREGLTDLEKQRHAELHRLLDEEKEKEQQELKAVIKAESNVVPDDQAASVELKSTPIVCDNTLPADLQNPNKEETPEGIEHIGTIQIAAQDIEPQLHDVQYGIKSQMGKLVAVMFAMNKRIKELEEKVDSAKVTEEDALHNAIVEALENSHPLQRKIEASVEKEVDYAIDNISWGDVFYNNSIEDYVDIDNIADKVVDNVDWTDICRDTLSDMDMSEYVGDIDEITGKVVDAIVEKLTN